jgi:hypothetical protein
MNTKEHKIFERFLNIDLKELTNYLEIKYFQILENKLTEENELNDIVVHKYNENNNASARLNKKYNIFKFENENIKTLYNELMLCAKDACEYYDIDFDLMNYHVRGWFNREIKTTSFPHDPITNERLYHDHLGGHPAPDFHGYFCVNAEPSSTYYKIDENTVYENINKNNRMILSENGRPHSRGIWNEDDFRITIAYDVVPFQRLVEQGADKKPVWMPFK